MRGQRTKRCREDRATHSATSSALSALRGVRLGERERDLLLIAPPPGSFECEGTITGGMPVLVSRSTLRARGVNRSAQVAMLRAARRLHDLGLVDYRTQRRGERRAYITLTDLGAAVVKRYRDELTNGQRIRWPRREDA